MDDEAAGRDADLEQLSVLTRTDEHREPIAEIVDSDRVACCVDHVVVGDAMTPCAFCDQKRRQVTL